MSHVMFYYFVFQSNIVAIMLLFFVKFVLLCFTLLNTCVSVLEMTHRALVNVEYSQRVPVSQNCRSYVIALRNKKCAAFFPEASLHIMCMQCTRQIQRENHHVVAYKRLINFCVTVLNITVAENITIRITIKI